MLSVTFENAADRLAEALVLLVPSDLPALAQMHQLFQDAGEAARENGFPRVCEGMNRCADLLQSIILEEVSDIPAAMSVISRAIDTALEIAQNRAHPDTAAFPAELGIETMPPANDQSIEITPSVEVMGVESRAEATLLENFDPAQGDGELLREFVNEAFEHLENAEVALLAMETAPEDSESINAVFRAFHTIKGVAGMLQITAMQKLAHESENLLDKVRKGELAVTPLIADCSLESVDALRALVRGLDTAMNNGGLLVPQSTLPALVARVRTVASGEAVSRIEAVPAKLADSDAVLCERLLERGALSHTDIAAALHEQLGAYTPRELGELLIRGNVITRSTLDEALEVQKQVPDKRLGEILIESGWATPDLIEAALRKQQEPPALPKLGEVLVRSGKVSAREVAEELRGQPQRGASTNGTREIVKVDAERLDHLLNMIGELVIAQSMVTQSESFRNAVSQEVQRHLHQLDRITRDLQETGMSLRMVPLRSTFQKMARLARDLSQKSGKPVEFSMSGEDTEVDKSMVDRIGDPLVHMIRNAMDHGLEATPEERMAAGKPAQGHVQLRAFHRQGSLIIEIEDDGRGLSRERILAKARERGLDRANDMLSDQEVWQLIFEPGFSTASVITDVSGRGVGMDVVRKNVEGMRGQIMIDSKIGSGTLFTIQLPLTLAIIDGMVVSVGQERYIIPTLSVTKSIQAHNEDLFTIMDAQEMLSLQGELIPLTRLARLFNVPGAIDNPTKGIIVVVESSSRKTGLLVDAILGQQQIVIKSLGHMVQQVQGVSGGAIMSDGNIGLILDVSGLHALSQESAESTHHHVSTGLVQMQESVEC